MSEGRNCSNAVGSQPASHKMKDCGFESRRVLGFFSCSFISCFTSWQSVPQGVSEKNLINEASNNQSKGTKAKF